MQEALKHIYVYQIVPISVVKTNNMEYQQKVTQITKIRVTFFVGRKCTSQSRLYVGCSIRYELSGTKKYTIEFMSAFMSVQW